MVKHSLRIVHLYHHNMNIYGDTGNVQALEYRLSQRHISAEITRVEIGETLPNDVDIIIAGGGQDTGQFIVEKDLHKKQRAITRMVQDGVVVLTICGTYQLFGHRFVTLNQKEIRGIGIFDLETKGSQERLVGNVVVKSEFGELVGFENHSGKTFLGQDQAALGVVLKGSGNNGQTGEEGALRHNCFGSYLHGPLLPKNPVFADELIRRALERKYGSTAMLIPLDDAEEQKAAKIAKDRPR